MADNTVLDSGSGGDTIATDDIGGVKYPRSKLVIGADGTNDGDVSSSNPLPVGGAILAAIQTAVETLDNAISGSEMQVDIVSSAAIPVTDNGGSLTVDSNDLSDIETHTSDIVGNTNSLTVLGGGTEATALRVTLANNSSGVLSIDDNGGSITVDGSVQITDGSNTATVRNLTSNDALNVAIVDGAGNQVTSFGGSGGTSSTDDSAFTAGTGSGTPIMGFASADTVDSGDVAVLAMDTSRRLMVSIEADNAGIGGGTQYTVDAVAPAAPTGNALLAERDDALGGVAPAEGDWTQLFANANGALWVAVDGSVAVTNADLTTIAGAVSGSEMQVDVVGALPAGTNAIGKLAANSGVDIGDVDVTSISAGSNLIGDVGIQGRTTGGLSTYYDNDLDETAVAVKTSAGTLYSLHVINTTAAPLYLQLFDVAQGSVTVGTTTPTMQFVVPGNADSDGAGFTISVPQGVAFSTAITAACSTDSEGNTAPGANACHVNLFYK